MDKLVTIYKLTALTLVLNNAEDTMSLRSMMPFHEVKIVNLTLREEESAESQ